MNKFLISMILLSAVSFAEDFEQFLDKAVKSSPYLKAVAFGVNQAQEEGDLLTRYENPTLELEYSRFTPNAGDGDNGFRVSYAQPIRLWGVGDDKDRLSQASVQSAHANLAQKRAKFIRDISLFYTRYAQQNMLVSLGEEELSIAKKIYEISKARYEVGTISRGVMLQSQVAYEMIQIQNDNLRLSAMQSYYDLLKQAGIEQEIELDAEHDFLIQASSDTSYNPDILTLHSAQEKARSQAAVNSNKVEWMSLALEYEKEPNQNIARFGAAFPLAFFNSKTQEKSIAQLDADKTDLFIENKNAQLDIDRSRLQKQRETLVRLKNQNTKVLKTEVELLKMFKDGYKIANTNLLELQDIKNKVIETKERLIEIKTALNQNAIRTNYMQGSYNE